MAIELKDISDAVQTYLNTKIAIAVALTDEGTSVNPGESFDVQIDATNADATSGGVALRNVKYRVSVEDGDVAKLIVPEGTFLHTTDLEGNDVTKGSERKAMIVEKTLETTMAAGGNGNLKVTGKASDAAKGGKTSVRVRLLADVDLDELFPQGEDTPAASTPLTVEG